jgi:quercetin dioxygenase-like cupin family protein
MDGLICGVTLPRMRSALRGIKAVLLVVPLASMSASSLAQAPQAAAHHAVVAADAIQWKSLRPGAEIAVVSGDPNKEGSPFVLRFRYRGKARIPPHWHPTDEHLTILSGTFRLGMGKSGDEAVTTALEAGAYAFVAAKMPHYAWTDGDTVIQAHGIGPFVINYVNPADDPNAAAKK